MTFVTITNFGSATVRVDSMEGPRVLAPGESAECVLCEMHPLRIVELVPENQET